MTPVNYRWAHAVNSNALLSLVYYQVQKALKQQQLMTLNHVNAIEADIIWNEDKQVSMMGHPPATDSDLTLSQFLHAMLKLAVMFQHSSTSDETPLIVKLDFKSSRAFEASLELLTTFMAKYPFTKGVFINADILPGPASSNYVAFDAIMFLEQVNELGDYENGQHRHKLVLSVGWTTTNVNEETIHREYTSDMIEAMLRVLKPYGDTLAVTFPVRATSVRKSWHALRPLLESPNYGLTLWWAMTQMPDDDLEWIYTTLECSAEAESSTGSSTMYANRTFYDIKGFSNFLARRG
ncbi:hypothetical protein KXD40_002517 [Peronospora effusa]|uniref:Menorin-like domain-containing protein n=1 Tax=Peronospora effusa TaxID=542832 RepID=A0A3M6V6Q2_9STRA|nr:hypothetical protein DD238_005192 [Peronospora effusa]RQM09972.1 hypothetical protein DD237_006054 [Peronospora effusa]UIZ26414.1 hypothetical protein KXD40_002517 [Peronospora effusa]